MCGRFTLTVDPAEMGAAFRNYNFPSQFVPRFNIAPSQPILAIPNDGNNKADFFIWGLIPSWAKDPTIGNRLINARGETLAEKPSFRGGYKYKRCLVLADGFYEWEKTPGTKAKVPHFIHMKTRKPFAFAGLWSEWHSPDGSQIRSCTIVTTQPNPFMAAIHDRMPVIIDPDDYQRWIDPAAQPPDSLQPLIKPYSADEMTAHPVSTLVNNPKNDRAECVVPA